MTEQERAFKKPAEQARGAAELSRPMRSVGGKPIVPKRVDLSVEGESDGLLPMDEPHEGPLREIPDIFPEKFQGAAGMKSGALVKKQGRSTSVEFNGERAVQDYISGEVDELIYGESLDPAAASAAREVPMLYPEKYMNAAGFTSKEVTHKVHRNKLQERLDNPEHKAAKPHFIGGVDRIIYGKPTAAARASSRRAASPSTRCGTAAAATAATRSRPAARRGAAAAARWARTRTTRSASTRPTRGGARAARAAGERSEGARERERERERSRVELDWSETLQGFEERLGFETTAYLGALSIFFLAKAVRVATCGREARA